MNLGGFLELSTSYAVDFLTIKLSQLRQESTLEFNGTLKAALSSSCKKYHPTPYQIVFSATKLFKIWGVEGGGRGEIFGGKDDCWPRECLVPIPSNNTSF